MNTIDLARQTAAHIPGNLSVVNDKVDDDSLAEHVIDVDTSVDGIVYNVSVTVIKMGPTMTKDQVTK